MFMNHKLLPVNCKHLAVDVPYLNLQSHNYLLPVLKELIKQYDTIPSASFFLFNLSASYQLFPWYKRDNKLLIHLINFPGTFFNAHLLFWKKILCQKVCLCYLYIYLLLTLSRRATHQCVIEYVTDCVDDITIHV